MRCKDKAEMFEVRHDVADGGGGERDRQDAREIARADGLAGREIALDDQTEDLARALVQRRQRDLRCADRNIVRCHGTTSWNVTELTIAPALFKPGGWLWCAPN